MNSNVAQTTAKLQFALNGFIQETGFRVFSFECTAADRSRTEYTVRADLAMARRYGIQIQDLAILCRGLLERCSTLSTPCALVFTEEDMNQHAHTCADAREAALQKRRTMHRPRPVRPSPYRDFHNGNNQVVSVVSPIVRERGDDRAS